MDYRVIKENDLFLLTDQMGNITKNHQYGLGLYTKDTRFLSGLNIKINGEDPILLASDADENYMATIRLTNPHIENEENLILWRESIEILRERFIYDGVLYETIKLKNYFPKRVDFTITVHIQGENKSVLRSMCRLLISACFFYVEKKKFYLKFYFNKFN